MPSFFSFFLHRIHLTALLLVFGSGQVFADGKMYIQLEDVSTSIPYQRAAIFFDEGEQTLILQSQYEIPNQSENTALAWIVPLPSVPEIESTDADLIERYPFLYLDIMTAPKTTSVLGILMIGFAFLWLACLIAAPTLLILTFFIKNEGFRKFTERVTTPVAIITFVGLFLFFGSFFFASAGKSATSVEVIKSKKAGIHDVRVIKAESAGDLIEWFNRYGFQSGPEDKEAIQAYIDRGWCFVASRIEHISDPQDPSKVSNHLLAPLILTFKTPRPVYPTALTATGGYDTEILIYLGTMTPFNTSAPIQLRGHEIHPHMDVEYAIGTEENDSIDSRTVRFKHLSKYKSTLTPEQMEKDIVFEPSEALPEYREHKIRW